MHNIIQCSLLSHHKAVTCSAIVTMITNEFFNNLFCIVGHGPFSHTFEHRVLANMGKDSITVHDV